jgi:hypothetical protein
LLHHPSFDDRASASYGNMVLVFNIESWIWYGFAMGIVLCRFLARFLHLRSVKKFQLDDWLMLVAVITETAFMITINKVVHYNSNLLAPGDNAASFTKEDIDERIYGSKLTVVVEQMQCCTIWPLKACLITLYWRVT